MGVADVVWMILILSGTGYLLHRSLWRRKGRCQGCDNVDCSRRIHIAKALILGCFLAPAAASPAADGDVRTERLTISGLVEVEAGFSGSRSDQTLATAQLGLGLELEENVDGCLVLLSENGADPVVDEAAITIFLGSWSARLGLQYLPFGRFSTSFVSDPLTLELGETRETAVLGSFQTDLLTLSAFIFNGGAERIGETDRFRDWGASLTVTPLEGLEMGASCLSDLADSAAGLFADAGNRYGRRVPGWSAFAVAALGPLELSAEVLGAVRRFADDDGGGRPLSWNLELASAPAPRIRLAMRAEGSSDFPEAAGRRYGVAASWCPRERLAFTAELLRTAGNDDARDTAAALRTSLRF